MKNALKAVLGAGIALVLAKWAYDEYVDLHQMRETNTWCDGYLDGIKSQSQIIAEGEGDTFQEALDDILAKAKELGVDPKDLKLIINKRNHEILVVKSSKGDDDLSSGGDEAKI